MKQNLFSKVILFFAGAMLIALSTTAQKKFTITSGKANNYCNGTCTLFDNPDLNGNPTAIVFITAAAVNGVNLDPHPICAYYNGKQWSVMNTDNSTMPVGAQFDVQYFVAPDESHFVHVVTKENLVKSNSYIDHAGLNGNAQAKFQFFQNAAPNIRGGLVNTNEPKFQYDDAAGKWFVSDSKGKPLDIATGYGISISSSNISTTNALTITSPATNTTAPVPPMANPNQRQEIFMTVVGTMQGQFPGENNNTPKISISSFEMEIISPTDMATGQSTGKRQHLPIMVQKANGIASLQFFKALTTNEKLTTVTFEIYKRNNTGVLVFDYKIVLTNASISQFKQSYAEDEGRPGSFLSVDSIKLIYQTIEYNYGGTGVSDTWPSAN